MSITRRFSPRWPDRAFNRFGIVGGGASVDFLPSDTSGLQLVLDYRDGMFQSEGGAAASLANDLLGYWQDLSGVGNHYSQDTSSDKPTIVDDGGLLIPEFDGISDFLETLSLLNAGGTSARTLLMKVKANTVGNGGMFCLNYDSGGSGAARWWGITSEVAYRVNGFELYSTALSTLNYQTLTGRNPSGGNISSLQAWLDGSELTASSGGGTDVLNIAGTKSALGVLSTSFFSAFRVKTVWFYNVEKDNTQRAALEAEMALIP